MRSFPIAMVLLLLAGGLAAPGCNRIDLAAAPDPERPSVLLVTIDTLRADHTPARRHLARLLARSGRSEQAAELGEKL